MDEQTIDITKIGLQNESLKLKNKKAERDLLSSISEHGVQEALFGFYNNDKDDFILIDGFKRYRCCKKLHINIIPIEVMANDEANAFIKTLKISNTKSLHILEQAKFIKSLQEKHHMTGKDIAASLDKSTNWVSTRLTLLKELTPLLEEKIFTGYFPVWNAMGVLHQCKRSNIATDNEINQFVEAVSGKGLPVKDIDILANGYFKGGKYFKEQVKNGNFFWSLNKLKDSDKQQAGLSDEEKRLLKDLEIASKYIGRLIFKLPQLHSNNDFYATGSLLAEGILDKLDRFKVILNNFIQENENDRKRQSECHMDTSSGRCKN